MIGKINLIEGKMGQADTITWFVGTVIIFFVIAFFIGAVASIASQDSGFFGRIFGGIGGGDEGKNSLPESNLENAKIIEKFLFENREVVSDWADKSGEIEDAGLGSEAKFEIYSTLTDSWLTFAEKNNLENSYFYARTIKNSIVVQKGIGQGNGFMEDLGNDYSFEFTECPNENEEKVPRVFISSEKGNLVMIVFWQDRENFIIC